MEQLREGLEAKIRLMLEERRRSAFLENFLLSLLFFAGGIVLTLLIWIVIDAYCWMFVFRSRMSSSSEANTLALLIFAGIIYWKRDRILQGEFADVADFTTENVSNTARTFDELFGSIVVGGPRFLVLGFRAWRHAKKIYGTDLFLLVRPIALAVQGRRKIREADLAGVRMEWFLENSDWIQGVVPLLRKPAGFTVTDDFVREALGKDILDREPRKTPYEPRDAESEPEPSFDAIDEEVRWAQMVLGVGRDATRAQINAAYRKFAKLVHPDVQGDDPVARAQSEGQMKDLNLAYEILRRQSKAGSF